MSNLGHAKNTKLYMQHKNTTYTTPQMSKLQRHNWHQTTFYYTHTSKQNVWKEPEIQEPSICSRLGY
jgi:hypothetical protein